MKKFLILLFTIAATECIKAQFLPNIDSLVIKLSIENETENWCYTFSFSERCIQVRGSDFYQGCFVVDEEVSNYTEEIKRKYVLFNLEKNNSHADNNYTHDVFSLTQSIIRQNCQKEIPRQEQSYDTIWHFSLYKDGDTVGYYFFDIDNSCIRNQQFQDLCSILHQIKKKRCPIANR